MRRVRLRANWPHIPVPLRWSGCRVTGRGGAALRPHSTSGDCGHGHGHGSPSGGPVGTAVPDPCESTTSTATIADCVAEAAKVLPNQAILENFVHQNPLAPFEHMPYSEAVSYVHHLERFMSPGARCFHLLSVDPRKRVNEALSDLCAMFLDRGAAKWTPEYREHGFLHFFAATEGLGFALWRRHARREARMILARLAADRSPKACQKLAEEILEQNLEYFGVPHQQWTAAVRSSMLELRGWAGMFYRMELVPAEAPPDVSVQLVEMVAVQSILIRSSMSSLSQGRRHIEKTKPDQKASMGEWLQTAPMHRDDVEDDQHFHNSAISHLDQGTHRQEELEKEFKQTLLEAVGTRSIPKPSSSRPKLQVWTCIDDREESLRRTIENANPESIETFGVAGFFGVPIRYKPFDGRDEMVLAPVGNCPQHTITEVPLQQEAATAAKWKRRQRLVARLAAEWEKASFSPIASLFLSGLAAPFSFARLFMLGFAPVAAHSVVDRFRRWFIPRVRTELTSSMPLSQAAAQLATTFNDIGTKDRFAPLVIIIGHHNTSVNNPFAAAYNCGACQGRDGGPNARLFAKLANDPAVRRLLAENHKIVIPDDTLFIGATHNTCADNIRFFEEDVSVPETHVKRLAQARGIMRNACGKNAWERCYRFLLARPASSTEALQHVFRRSIDYSEVRPELNHATNAAVVVGRRDLTKGRFLDRRVFLPSYDPFSDDERGSSLERVLTPALIVCSGINLEYLFSTADVDHHGAGTKVPLNVVGNVGVLQGTTGDLRPGLPSQMTEMHTPIRALFIVDAPVKRVEEVLSRKPQLRNLVYNDWVRFVVRDPETNTFFKQVNGKYFPVMSATTETTISFEAHRHHATVITQRETRVYYAALVGALLACFGPIAVNYDILQFAQAGSSWLPQSLNFAHLLADPRGAIIAIAATGLSLPTLAFARRYLHGEHLFGWFASLCVSLLLGFSLVATATTLTHAVEGWILFGFASTFLIGAYNERQTVRSNAIFAFAMYTLGDLALVTATAFTGPHAHAAFGDPATIAAGGLLMAALLKSSQFPLTNLFARSMEGPTPSSALGYAGLSAHIGIVLLATNTPLWLGLDWARASIAAVGLITAVTATLNAHLRSDRKGALAYATSATLGLIFVILALGYTDLALFLSFGHAAFRMTQVMRAPNIITDTQKLRAALEGKLPWPTRPLPGAFRLAWLFRRFDLDFNFLNVLRAVVGDARSWYRLNGWQQWVLTAVCVLLAGFPFSPFSEFLEHSFRELAEDHPAQAAVAGLVYTAFATALIRLVFVRILHPRRFHRSPHTV